MLSENNKSDIITNMTVIIVCVIAGICMAVGCHETEKTSREKEVTKQKLIEKGMINTTKTTHYDTD